MSEIKTKYHFSVPEVEVDQFKKDRNICLLSKYAICSDNCETASLQDCYDKFYGLSTLYNQYNFGGVSLPESKANEVQTVLNQGNTLIDTVLSINRYEEKEA